ncbi:hypothetical protein EV144_101832 [Flavobacterium sp. 270]|nr:hypothetical protein EV145_106134 [Flavobacterium sp. 245]TDW52148.1 hypothetical protein EV144_101832 [Flavobacterium sp. 270]
MYKSKPTVVLFLLFSSFISINCGNCDDENYTREKKENLHVKKTDTLTFKKQP